MTEIAIFVSTHGYVFAVTTLKSTGFMTASASHVEFHLGKAMPHILYP